MAPPVDVGIPDTAPPPVDVIMPPPDTGPARPPIYCGPGMTCPVATGEACCVSNVDFESGTGTADYSCGPVKSCYMAGNIPVLCDTTADCPTGELCCGTKMSSYGEYAYVRCEATCPSTAANTRVIFCDPSASPSICAAVGKSCLASGLLPGYYVCTG
jgi:hypothetical protein